MKKTILVIQLFIIAISLSGCSNNQLDNDFFENTSEESFDEFYKVYSKKLSLANEQLDFYYPRPYQEEVMWFEDGYLNAQLFNKDEVYKHEFYNYSLSDDRQFMRFSKLYYLDELSLSRIVLEESFDDIKEGVEYYNSSQTNDGKTVKSGLQFFIDDEELYYEFMYTINTTTLYHYVFHFYTNESWDDVMEMTLHISDVSETSYESMSYTKLISGKSEEVYVCNNCDVNNPEEGSLEYMYTKFREYDSDDYQRFDESDIESYFRVQFLKEHDYGTIFNGLTGERYDVSENDEGYSTNAYYEYIRDTNLVSYTPYHFTVNMYEILGWDKLVEIDIPNEYNTYQLYYGDELLSDEYYGSIVFDHSEYPYFDYHTEFNSETQILDEIITLDIFGLSSGYSKSYFNDKFQQGSDLYLQELGKHNIDKDYEENYEIFMQHINKFR